MAHISDVFGIQPKIPTYTYVDRAGLDAKLNLLLLANQHIVIHGTSKQGKTVLRRKSIPDEKTIVVACLSNMSLRSVYAEILRKLGANKSKDITVARESSTGRSSELTFASPGPASLVKLKFGAEDKSAQKIVEKKEPIGEECADNVGFIAEQIFASKRTVVIEDFHYLPESVKKDFAFALKAFWDSGVFFIIIGIWAEHNLLTYYNGDLNGRIQEIDVEWTTAELGTVLERGMSALNIFIPHEICTSIVSDANKNVGLVQRQAQQFCFGCGVIKTVEGARRLVNDQDALVRSRRTICDDLANRYQKFCEAVRRGFKKDLRNGCYELILRVCMASSSTELLNGIYRDTVIARCGTIDQSVTDARIGNALKKFNRLQTVHKIYPLILSYNSGTRTIQLIDRELLFYRKYGQPRWPWDMAKVPVPSTVQKPLFSDERPVPSTKELRDVIAHSAKRMSRGDLIRRLILDFHLSVEQATASVDHYLGARSNIVDETTRRSSSIPRPPKKFGES